MYYGSGGYYHAMDRGSYKVSDEMIEEPIKMRSGEEPWNIDLGPRQIGTGVNPFQHSLQALNAKIKEGASKAELVFFGAGKGNKDRFTPESIDKEEREELRNLAQLNEVTTSTHATVAIEGIAGFNPQRGFEEQQRDQALREIKKAIDFASEASTGGAIVFHTGEWQRPIVDSAAGKEGFTGYAGEEKRAPIMVIDKRTGEMIAMRKDMTLYEPEFKTVKQYEEEKGVKLIGTKDKTDNTFEENDWISIKGDVIKKDWEFDPKKTREMFGRVPNWNQDETNFRTQPREWNYFIERAKEWNEQHSDNQLTPEEIYAKIQYSNQVLQAKGSSLYHASRYSQHRELRGVYEDALNFYQSLEDSMEEEQKKKLVTRKFEHYHPFVVPKEMKIVDYLTEQVKEHEDMMRYIHESSASADVQAKKAEESMTNVTTVEKYGLQKSAESLAELGIHTWQKYEQHKDQLDKPLYVAPENWDPKAYGSHPDEFLKIIKEGRRQMIDKLSPSMGKDRAEELAKRHIKSTIDIGHLNLWKSHLQRKTDEHGNVIESDEAFDKRFTNWAIEKMEKLHKEEALGHIHLADNFGYDDEHLSIGKGNAPVKEFVKFMKEKGYEDFIVEAGSFNAQTTLAHAWSQLGSPVYSISGPGHGHRFTAVHQQDFGYQAPPFYIVGSYAPSNEWKLWSEVPLE